MQSFDFEALNRKPQDNNQRMVHYQQLFNEVKEKILNIKLYFNVFSFKISQ